MSHEQQQREVDTPEPHYEFFKEYMKQSGVIDWEQARNAYFAAGYDTQFFADHTPDDKAMYAYFADQMRQYNEHESPEQMKMNLEDIGEAFERALQDVQAIEPPATTMDDMER